MKAQFYLGMGLGAVAAASVLMMMEPGKDRARKTLKEARQTVDKTIDKLGM
ncbi:MAG: hypothetical protein IK095_08080 [Oscillospiraceae bacterium]|nr:hypothetical protein [Oscillospiraceae bacterium]